MERPKFENLEVIEVKGATWDEGMNLRRTEATYKDLVEECEKYQCCFWRCSDDENCMKCS